MAPDAQSLPPPQFIVPKTGIRLAAGASINWALNVEVFDPDKAEQEVCPERLSFLDLSVMILVVQHLSRWQSPPR